MDLGEHMVDTIDILVVNRADQEQSKNRARTKQKQGKNRTRTEQGQGIYRACT